MKCKNKNIDYNSGDIRIKKIKIASVQYVDEATTLPLLSGWR